MTDSETKWKAQFLGSLRGKHGPGRRKQMCCCCQTNALVKPQCTNDEPVMWLLRWTIDVSCLCGYSFLSWLLFFWLKRYVIDIDMFKPHPFCCVNVTYIQHFQPWKFNDVDDITWYNNGNRVLKNLHFNYDGWKTNIIFQHNGQWDMILVWLDNHHNIKNQHISPMEF